VVTRHLGDVGVALWDRCLASLNDDTSLRHRVSLGGKLLAALAPHRRRSRPADAATRVLRRVQWGWTRVVLRRPDRKRLERAGLTVAVLGDDGSVPTTVAHSVADWLGATFVVKRAHLGNPRLREYRALRRVADAGGVVVCDGWPLPELRAEAQRRSDARIAPPDVLVVLRSDPTDVLDLNWSTTPAVVIDATQPSELILAGIRVAIWERL
jgi:hypothetical protein